MCGIGGCIGEGASTDLVRRMSNVIKHRGPDDYGEFVDHGVSLFSNRLSIIDLEGGHQPVFNENDSLVIVYNGEIYNFPETKLDLESKGHRFKTRTDTEVVLHGFEEYGPRIFSTLDGMFAIAIWDITKKRLVLARDRVGVKPLFYSRTESGDFVFCSEIKGILEHHEIRPAVSERGLYYLMSLYYIPFEVTMFSGIYKIPPGNFFDSSSGKIAPYWSPPRSGSDFVPGIEQVRLALENSVRRQLISDVEVGSFLSGGLDTSTVVAFASKHYPQKLKTFCMGFGHEDDELHDAKIVSEFFATDHYEFTISDRETLELYPKMIWHSELPKLNTYSWFVNEYARKFVKVCLSGLGGDEIFFGYPTSNRFAAFQRAQSLMKVPGSSVLSVFASGKRKKVMSSLKDRASTYLTTVSPIYNSLDKDVFNRPVDKFRKELTMRMHQDFFNTSDDFVQQSVFAEFSSKLPDDFLSIDDSMSMAHSLENRVPLLDNELVELMLPVSYKFNFEGGVGKALLRKAMKDILPERCFEKKKQGFSLDVLKWWPGELGEEIRNTVSESEIVRRFFDVAALVKLIPEAKNSFSKASFLWSVYAFHIWYGVFVEGKIGGRLAAPEIP